MKMKAFSTALVLLVLASVPAVFAVNVDGTIASGEYSKQAVFDKGNFKLLWEFEGDKVFMAIVAKTPGWVAIGFNPSTVMAKSDMVLGLVKDQSDVQAVDEWSSGIFGPHAPDVDKGGKSDILSYAGTRTDDTVVFEFSRLLNTGDQLDNVIPTSGKFKVIWAYGPSLDVTAKHKKAGSATIQMEGQK
jgi:hypothetical protein